MKQQMVQFANSLLVGLLGQQLLNSQVARGGGRLVFLVNPITLTTLTWISCFSYVLGTALALASLLAFWTGSTEDAEGRLLGWIIALACYVAGLFCSHELFFLPVLFVLFDWLRREAVHGWGAALFVAAMAFAVLAAWSIGPALVLIALVVTRFMAEKLGRTRRAKREAPAP